MFKNIRIAIGRYFLKKEMARTEKNRVRGVFNFDDARTIGIVYDATNRETYEKVRNFVKYLKEKHKKIVSLGFINTKNPDQILKAQLEFRFFTKKDLNWCFQPNCMEVKNFLEGNHDILIDLCIEKKFPIKYICGLSRAKFKVGITGKNNMIYYDLMLDIEKRKTIENYIIQLKHYLNIINKPEHLPDNQPGLIRSA